MKLHELHLWVHCLACKVGELEYLYSHDGEDRYRCRGCKAEHVHAYGPATKDGRPCGDCGGKGMQECPECDGDCVCECHCGDTHDCHACSGQGEVECNGCGGEKRKGKVPSHGPCGLALDGGAVVVDACRWNDKPTVQEWDRYWAERGRAAQRQRFEAAPAVGAAW